MRQKERPATGDRGPVVGSGNTTPQPTKSKSPNQATAHEAEKRKRVVAGNGGDHDRVDDGPAEDGARLLDDVHAYLGRFVAYPSPQAHDAHALWIVHAHMMPAWESTPRIAFLSPEPGSGKTRALEVTAPIVPLPVETVNVSPAYIFRKVGSVEGPPTLLFDEIR
jgi:hypothetical protein